MGGEGALRHSDSSSRSFAVIFPRLQCSHTADSKTLENHLKLVSWLFCKITLCLISFSSLGI